MRLLELPQRARRRQVLVRQRGFLRPQHAAGGREGLRHPVLQTGVAVRERPAIVRFAGAVAGHLVGFQAGVIDVVVGNVHRIAGDVVLGLRVLDDSGEDMVGGAERPHQAFRAVFDLLEKVVFPIRDMQQHLASRAADRGHIDGEMEFLLGEG